MTSDRNGFIYIGKNIKGYYIVIWYLLKTLTRRTNYDFLKNCNLFCYHTGTCNVKHCVTLFIC